jgi:hypothetical protein
MTPESRTAIGPYLVVALGVLTLKIDGQDNTAERYVVVDTRTGALAPDPELNDVGYYDTQQVATQACAEIAALDSAAPVIERAATISTAHLAGEIRDKMLNDPAALHFSVYCDDRGAFLIVLPSDLLFCDRSEIDVASLIAVNNWALEHGLTYVRLDCDAPTIAGLPTYG